ncbi:hypothetical protein ANN_17710 [Periplaneta americana]|uniref:Uncharacterized protein n=1 Tax=Periplaneta americana TaxID=6978 RepID=A0ABQ8SVU7_PERAM|nr:hypothetical protein ANN_17710 [Periplaneta americana]
MLENHSTNKNLNKDWKIMDLKSSAQKVLRLTLTFKMAPQRVITYSKILGKHRNDSVTVQNTYTACPVAVWLLKPRIKTCGNVLNSPALPEVNMVFKVKKNDVKKLMQYFEVTGEAKNLYTTVLADVSHQPFVIKL